MKAGETSFLADAQPGSAFQIVRTPESAGDAIYPPAGGAGRRAALVAAGVLPARSQIEDAVSVLGDHRKFGAETPAFRRGRKRLSLRLAKSDDG